MATNTQRIADLEKAAKDVEERLAALEGSMAVVGKRLPEKATKEHLASLESRLGTLEGKSSRR